MTSSGVQDETTLDRKRTTEKKQPVPLKPTSGADMALRQRGFELYETATYLHRKVTSQETEHT